LKGCLCRLYSKLLEQGVENFKNLKYFTKVF